MKNFKSLTEDVCNELIKLHYTSSTINHYKRKWLIFSVFAKKHHIKEFSTDSCNKFLKTSYGLTLKSKKCTRSERESIRAMQVLIDFKNSQIVYRRSKSKDHSIDVRYNETYNNFISTIEAKLSTATIRQFRSHLEAFIHLLVHNKCKSFSELTPLVLNKYFESRKSLSLKSRAYDVYVMHKFLDYLYEKKITKVDLSVFVPLIKSDNRSTIPSHFSTDELTKVINIIDRSNPVGKRDFAVILLAIRYGLRAGDIRNLKLSSFDWNNGKINIIQSKSNQLLSLPMLQDVSNAIIDYLKNGRPNSDSKNVFISHNAPYDALANSNTFYDRIAMYLKLAGIPNIQGRKHGLHSLRHSIAGNLLQQGVAMPIISEILGHSSTETTMIYTKIDTSNLRKCALEVSND